MILLIFYTPFYLYVAFLLRRLDYYDEQMIILFQNIQTNLNNLKLDL